MAPRSVLRVHHSIRDDIRDLITRRPLPGPQINQIDPFLFLNHHGPQVYPPHNRGLPFGPHPHRGFETVTVILAGDLLHRDNAGHDSIIHAGGIQWMTAGRGIEHAELSSPGFIERGGPLEILQLWVNLPARLKMTQPRYTGVQADAIPCLPIMDGRASARLIAGTWNGISGAIQSLTDVTLMTVALAAGINVTLPAPGNHHVLCYVVRGQVTIGTTSAPAYTLVDLQADGDAVEVTAETDSLLLYGHAQPLAEPVVARGPFVMNTIDEIHDAIADYRSGRFGSALT